MRQRKARRLTSFPVGPDSTRTNWNHFTAWHLMLPPARPSRRHLRVVQSNLLQFQQEPQKMSACILGSTPELRDLAAEMGCANVTVIDHNRHYHESVEWLRTTPGPETILFNDWITALSSTPAKYDAILSDFTLGNIEYSRRKAFLRSIQSALAPNGVFIDRVLTNEIPLIPLDELRIKFQRRPGNLRSLNSFFCETLFCSSLLEHRTIVAVDEFINEMQKIRGFHGFDWCVDNLSMLVPAGAVWYYGTDWAAVRSEFSAFFESLNEVLEP